MRNLGSGLATVVFRLPSAEASEVRKVLPVTDLIVMAQFNDSMVRHHGRDRP